MFEIVLTIVSTETHDDVTYPVTQIRRIEFDTQEDMTRWLDECVDSNNRGIVHAQTMIKQ